jgi:hypothetical protein
VLVATIILGVIFNHLQTGLSSCVTTQTISNLLSLYSCSKKGTPISADEKNTMR